MKLGALFYLVRWCAATPHAGNAFIPAGPYQLVQIVPTVRYRICGDRVPRDFALRDRETFAEHGDAMQHAAKLNRDRANQLLEVAAVQEMQMREPTDACPDPIDFAAQGHLLAAATPGPWCTTQSATATKEDAVEWFRHHISFGADMPMAGVGCPDHPLTVIGADPMRPEHMVEAATTGNGPTSVANAAAIASMRNTIDAYREVVVAAKDIAMSPYTDQDAAMDPEKCGRIKVLLSLVQRERLVAAIARFRNVGVEAKP